MHDSSEKDCSCHYNFLALPGSFKFYGLITYFYTGNEEGPFPKLGILFLALWTTHCKLDFKIIKLIKYCCFFCNLESL
jgi:hypothetical protein